MPKSSVLRIAKVRSQKVSWPREVVPNGCAQDGGASSAVDIGVERAVGRDRRQRRHAGDHHGEERADGELAIVAEQVADDGEEAHVSFTRGSKRG